ncbi:MAG: flagellar motor switch protein FliN [Bryobacterales bacterium]|nr:flagellar motor switch protein FliN [Bryobacterales bacterium]
MSAADSSGAPSATRLAQIEWLGRTCGESLSQVLEALTGERAAVSWGEGAPQGSAAGAALRWRQDFGLGAGAAVLATLAADSWRKIGARVLGAAGVEEPGEQESRNTCLEVLSQSFAGLQKAIEQRTGRAVASAGQEAENWPEAERAGSLKIVHPDGLESSVELACTPPLLEALGHTGDAHSRPAPPAAEALSASATLDLLRDIELPVSISFGRTEMALQDVVKLTAGSVIELDRSVNDPVSVIVNGTAVALGEVVVMEGNYGVRIREVLSREKLLRSSGVR